MSQRPEIEAGRLVRRNQRIFQYQSLGANRSIRLLTILPGLADDPIRCSCSTISLDDAIQTSFEAISYVWGDDAKVRTIEVNQCRLDITKNAYAVLGAARFATSSRIVWIDAICINQANIDEKNQQVRLMTDIYSTATSVFAWLGEAAPDTSLAMILLKLLKPIYIEYHEGITYEITPHSRGTHGILLQDLCKMTGQIDSKPWVALRALLKRPWWRRVWVYQEVVLAKTVTLVCGKYSIDFRDCAPIIHWLMYCQAFVILHDPDVPGDSGPSQSTLSGLTNLDRMHETRFTRRYNKYSLDLEKHLCEPVHWEATNPRDFIYGVMGIIEKTTSENIELNYRDPVVEVFTAATKWVITSKKSLRIVLTTRWPRQNLGKRVAGLPSWVPDFTIRSTVPSIGAVGEKSLGAGNYRDPCVRFDGPRLIVKGYLIGHIDSLGRPNDKFFEDQRAQHIAVEDWITESISDLEPVATGQLWHTLIQGRLTEGELRATGHTYHAGYEHWQTLVKHMRARKLGFQHVQTFLKLALKPAAIARGLNYASVLSALTRFRRLAKISVRKSDRGPIGVVPQEAMVGDIICVIFGASVPVLLRQVQDHDSLCVVGGCYVEDISLLISDLTSGPSPPIQEEEICIR